MTFRILDKTGDSVETFDMAVAEEAALAASQFNEYLNKGKQIIGEMPDGTSFMSGLFDPTAVRYIVGPRMVGG